MKSAPITLSEGAPSVLYAPDCIVCGMSAHEVLQDGYTGEPIPVCRSHRTIAERPPAPADEDDEETETETETEPRDDRPIKSSPFTGRER